MTIFGNICVGLLGLGAFVMLRFVSNSVSQYDYIAAILFSLFLLIPLFAVFATITANGKMDFLGWPRLLQYGGVAIASLSLTVLMGVSAAVHGSGGREFPWSIRPFCPWAAYMVPLGMALIAFFWLNSSRFALPEYLLRTAFGVVTAIALLSNITLGVEIRRNLQQRAEEQAREDLLVVQQADAEKDFSRLLHYTNRFERPATRQLALQKVLATGPRFNALMTECLRNPVFQEGLTYFRDNDPPGDAAPLAEPARDALFLSAKRLREEFATGRTMAAGDIESGVDTVLTVADKFSKYGVDLLPAVRDYRAALDAPKYGKVPLAGTKRMDAWLSAKGK
ncbi:hypothetical protein CfE428DRAFT_0760 [Chthoniobacter flavus Ellin428]|uniref:Uncharacterized protein n=1 Tax=Chthoniobacter flavus Ellin428 TaxID=497964 RepID=B4CVS3_9BACT|nr:hypothetical protein [Chthoniobacter flavus]EDY21515.1 hypothetical protein CfE428DRAFT_0760 [Chthoniobacter flavus Ellin428]TCO95465.1 hypothetical protein EV701_101152 [Chthoniobacter flavus]